MTNSERKKRTKELKQLIGTYVIVLLKSSAIRGNIEDDNVTISNATDGYVVDVSDCYIYLGSSQESLDNIICIDDISNFKITIHPDMDIVAEGKLQ